MRAPNAWQWMSALVAISAGLFASCDDARRYGYALDGGPADPRTGSALPARPGTRSCLDGVDLEEGAFATMPDRLSETGCFVDLPTRSPAADLVPFAVNSPLWSDGTGKRRFIVLPPGARAVVETNDSGNLDILAPIGTVWIKEFAIDLDAAQPDATRPLEMRFIVRGASTWGFFTYRFDEDANEAWLIPDGEAQNETLVLRGTGGTAGRRELPYVYPSRAQCRTCHSSATERVLGFRVDQLNRRMDYDGVREEQLVALHEAGVLTRLTTDGTTPDPDAFPALVDPRDDSQDPEARARSYLHSNCSHCHRPLGQSSSALNLDLRIERTLEETHLCDEVQFFAPEGTLRIAPRDPDASYVIQRLETEDPFLRMPPLGRTLPDFDGGVRALRFWVSGLSECP